MNTRPSTYTDLVTFSAAHVLPYGQSVTILDKPVRQNGYWVTNVMLSSTHSEEIHLNTDQINGSHFVVLRSEHTKNGYSYTAVLVDEMEKESQRIEENIINLLKRI